MNLMAATVFMIAVLFWGNTIAQRECHFFLDVTGNDSPYCGTTTSSACKTLGQVSIQIGSCATTVVHIASGIYTGYGNRNVSFIFTGKNLLFQASNPGSVIFDAENKMDILSLQIDNGIVQFEGITFARGRTQQHGGCVSIISENEGLYQFSDCWFIECSTISEGGALYAKVASPSMLVRVAFLACTALYGGAAMFDGGSIAIKDCIFSQNTTGGKVAIGSDAFYTINAKLTVEKSLLNNLDPEPPQPQRQPEVQLLLQPQPQPHVQPKPSPQPHVQPKPKPSPQPHVQPKPKPSPQPHVQPKPSPQHVQPKPLPQPHVQPKPSPQPNVQPKPSPQHVQPKPLPQPHVQPKPSPQPHVQPKPSPQLHVQPQPSPQPHVQPQPLPQPHVQPQPLPQPHVQPQPQPLPRPHVQPQPSPQPHVQLQPQPLPQPHVQPQPSPQPHVQPKPLPQPHVQPQPQPSPQPHVQPKPSPPRGFPQT